MTENINPVHNILYDPKEPVAKFESLPSVLKEFIRQQKAETFFVRNNQAYEFVPEYRANIEAPENRLVDPDSLAIRPCGEV